MIVLTLPDRVIMLRLGGVGYVERLASDTAAFLAGANRCPKPPITGIRGGWSGSARGVGLALAAGPLVLAEVAGLAFCRACCSAFSSRRWGWR